MDDSVHFSIENKIIMGKQKPRESNSRTIGRMIFEALDRDPDHVGQIDAETGRIKSFADLRNDSVRIASWLRKQGVEPTDVVAVCSPIHPDVSAIMFSTLYIGAIYNPWDHEIDIAKARNLFSKIQPKIMFCTKNIFNILSKATKMENLSPKFVFLDKTNDDEALKSIIESQSVEDIMNIEVQEKISPDNVSLIAFTSGTVGISKAVAHTHEAVLTNVLATLDDNETVYVNSTCITYFFPSWNLHVWFTLASILSKQTLIIHRIFNAVETCKLVEKYKINYLNLHTYQLMHICHESSSRQFNFDSVRVITPVGTKLRKRILDITRKIMPKAFVRRRMGMTETGEIARYTKSCNNWASTGYVRPNVHVKIIDKNTGEKLGPYEEGELCVKTPGMMKEYYNDPEALESAFDKEGWFHTDDGAYYDENGELIITGRLIEIIKYRYFDIYPPYLENILIQHPGVMDIAVVPMLHPLDIERPMVFAQRVSGFEISEHDLVKLTSDLGYNELRDGEVHFLQELPRSSNGKVNKRNLKLLANQMFQNFDSKLHGESHVIRDKNFLKTNLSIYKENLCLFDKDNIGEIIFENLIKNENHIGQIEADTGKRFTFGDINNQSIRLAVWMIRQSIESSDIVSLCTSNQCLVTPIIIATFYVGAIYSPWDHELDFELACKYMKAIQPKIIFACAAKADILAKAAKLEDIDVKIIVLEQHQKFLSVKDISKLVASDEISNFRVAEKQNPKDIGLIMFSSGTTGRPKAIAHTYDKILCNVVASGLDDELENETDVSLNYIFPSWNIHVWFLLDSIMRKSTEIICSNFDTENTYKIIEKFEVSIIYLHTYQLMHLCTAEFHQKYKANTVKVVIPVGTKLDSKLINKTKDAFPGIFISHGMGMTETGELLRYTKKCQEATSEGFPRPGVQIKIINVKSGEIVGPNITGELCVKTPTMMAGYYEKDSIIGDKSEFDDNGWFHTGDQAYFNDNGEFMMCGRLQEVIKYRYYDIYPANIEVILRLNPEVVDVAVVPTADPLNVERPIAFVQLVLGSQITKREIANMTIDCNYNQIFEHEIEFIEQLPRNSNGKINKKALKNIVRSAFKCS